MQRNETACLLLIEAGGYVTRRLQVRDLECGHLVSQRHICLYALPSCSAFMDVSKCKRLSYSPETRFVALDLLV